MYVSNVAAAVSRGKVVHYIMETLGEGIQGIFKRLWSPEIDSKERILPVYAASRAGTVTLFLLGS
jgi:hypothetical protein